MLERLHDLGFFSDLDVHAARTWSRLGGDDRPLVVLAAALASRAPQHGHVCVHLGQLPRPAELEPWPALEVWQGALADSTLVSDGTHPTPLVLDPSGRLYLYRYWRYQHRLATALLDRATTLADFDPAALADSLSRLIPAWPGDPRDRDQGLACLMAVTRRLAVISGGPGTGKTHTVLNLIAMLQEQALVLGTYPLRVTLVAPTGKAAARLAESIEAKKVDLEVDWRVLKAIPRQASTIHRALVWRPDAPTRFRHGADEPLPTDVVVVDESSMVDLALMTKLVEAVPHRARLVLLGDRDQLASVEAGAILGDICNAGGEARPLSSDFASLVQGATGHEVPSSAAVPPGIQDCMVHLSFSWRFEAASGIGALAAAVNAGDGEAALQVLADPGHPDVAWVTLDEGADPARVLEGRIVRGFEAAMEATDPGHALGELEAFRILCAHRRGRHGVEHLNSAVRRILASRGLVPRDGDWYPGRPVLITRNDYAQGLFNGDMGLALVDPEDGQLRVWFPGRDRGLRSFHPARLPPHETAFALTVHKSQGSEFAQVLVVLPGADSRILTRELLYTAVTRARDRVVVAGGADAVREAVGRRVQRASGLGEALWAAVP